MHPFAFAASRGLIAAAALLAWLASWRRALPVYGSHPSPRVWNTIGHMVVLGTTNRWLTNVLTATAVSPGSADMAMPQATVPMMVAVLAREHRAGVRS